MHFTAFNIHPIRLLATILLFSFLADRASAQNLYVANGLIINNQGRVSEYNSNTGAAVQTPFVSGFNAPTGLALAGSTLYVASNLDGRINAYDAMSGTPAAGFTPVTAARRPFDVLAGNGLLYVSDMSTNTVSAYNAGTGAAVPTFGTITGLNQPTGLGMLGATLYVASGNVIQTYDALTGTLLNASFVSGFSNVQYLTLAGTTLYVSQIGTRSVQAFDALTGDAIAGFAAITLTGGAQGLQVSGNILYVGHGGLNDGFVSEYNATSGALINAQFIRTPDPSALLISGIPEPST